MKPLAPSPPRRRPERLPFRRLLAVAVVLAAACLAAGSCLRMPRTRSVPPGLYLLTYEAPRRGRFLVVCLPERLGTYGRERGYLAAGPCPGGASEVLKRVAALPGDVVEVTDGGLVVNGEPLPATARRALDSAGRAVETVPAGRYRVEPGTLWLYATHSPRSWDSRYYGAIPLVGVRSSARRLLSAPAFSD